MCWECESPPRDRTSPLSLLSKHHIIKSAVRMPRYSIIMLTVTAGVRLQNTEYKVKKQKSNTTLISPHSELPNVTKYAIQIKSTLWSMSALLRVSHPEYPTRKDLAEVLQACLGPGNLHTSLPSPGTKTGGTESSLNSHSWGWMWWVTTASVHCWALANSGRDDKKHRRKLTIQKMNYRNKFCRC